MPESNLKPSLSVLVIFCKWPRLNQGKQRLAKTIGAELALEVAKLLLDCAMEDAADWLSDNGCQHEADSPREVVFAISEQADIKSFEALIKLRVEMNENISVQLQS